MLYYILVSDEQKNKIQFLEQFRSQFHIGDYSVTNKV